MNKDLRYDRRVTYSKDGRGFSADPKQILMAAARMERDGWSLERIRTELALHRHTSLCRFPCQFQEVTDQHLRNALRTGHQLLTEAIARGEEPEESVIDVGQLLAEEEVVHDEEPSSPKLWTPGGGNA